MIWSQIQAFKGAKVFGRVRKTRLLMTFLPLERRGARQRVGRKAVGRELR